jgi:hypothetical protein
MITRITTTTVAAIIMFLFLSTPSNMSIALSLLNCSLVLDSLASELTAVSKLIITQVAVKRGQDEAVGGLLEDAPRSIVTKFRQHPCHPSRSAPRRHALRQCGAATLRQPPLAATDRLATIDPFAELAEAPRPSNAKGAQP